MLNVGGSMRFLVLVLILFISTACQQQLEKSEYALSIDPVEKISIENGAISAKSIDSSLSQVLEDNGNLQFVLKASSDPSDKDDFWKVGEIKLSNSYEIIIPENLSIRGLFKSELVIINFDQLFCSYTYVKSDKNFVLDSCFLKSDEENQFYSLPTFVVSNKINMQIIENDDQVSGADIEVIIPAKVVGQVVADEVIANDEVQVEDEVDFSEVAVVAVDEVEDLVNDEGSSVVEANDVVEVDVVAEEEVVDSVDQEVVLEQVDSAMEGCQPDREHSLRKCLKSIHAYKLIKILAKGYLRNCKLQDKPYSPIEAGKIQKHYSGLFSSPQDQCRLDQLPYFIVDELMRHCKLKKLLKHRPHHHKKKLKKIRKKLKLRRLYRH